MINTEYLDKLKEFCTTEREISQGLFFGFLITYKGDFPDLESYMLDGQNSVLPYETFQLYSINLCKKNVDSRQNELVVPLIGYTDSSEYGEFLTSLHQQNVYNTGHVNNILQFSIFDKDDKKDFNELKTRLGSAYDRDKLAIVVSNYYEITQYAKKLGKYFREDGYVAYKTYSQ